MPWEYPAPYTNTVTPSRTFLGIDIGGTFTDLVMWNGRTLRTAKTPSTPDDWVRGVCAGLSKLGFSERAAPGRSPDGPIIEMVHGSTVATNALLERKGDRVAFITTAGVEDLLLIGRQDRPELYTFDVRRPPPLVQRQDCFGVVERIGADGEVVTPLDETSLQAIVREISSRGIEAAAVCLLFSHLNPSHEQRVAEALRAAGLRADASSDLLPEFREFERAATTVINAYVAGKMTRYLQRLEAAAQRHGIVGVRVMQSSGGQIGVEAACRQAVRTILSGPAGGVVAAAHVARRFGVSRFMTYDMGGTSTDVALYDGEIALRTDTTIGGMPIAVPMLAIHTVGAGGGSIASLDEGGALRVGPESAGADPGPACYGRGDLPTVTDAHVVLGRLRPEHFLGGTMKLDAARSHAAMAALAARMRCDATAAARAVIAVCGANMEHALTVVSAQQGHDPADFWLVSYGGAGGLHACDLAESLGLPGVIVAAQAGLLSAMGLMLSDIVMDFSRSLPRAASGIDLNAVRYETARLMDQAADAVTREGYDLDDVECDRLIDLRYAGQAYSLTLPIESMTDAARLAAPFHALHEKRYGFSAPDRPVEAVTVRVRARIATGAAHAIQRRPAQAAPTDSRPAPPEALLGTDNVWFDEPRSTPLLRRDRLPPGASVSGPALLLDDFSTTIVRPRWRADAMPEGHIRLTHE